MFAKSDTESKLDAEISAALAKLDQITDKTSKEYETLIDNIVKLHKLKSEDTQNQIKIEETLHKFEADSKRKLPSPDTMLVVAANLIGVIWITQHERLHVISRNTLGYIMKPR